MQTRLPVSNAIALFALAKGGFASTYPYAIGPRFGIPIRSIRKLYFAAVGVSRMPRPTNLLCKTPPLSATRPPASTTISLGIKRAPFPSRFGPTSVRRHQSGGIRPAGGALLHAERSGRPALPTSPYGDPDRALFVLTIFRSSGPREERSMLWRFRVRRRARVSSRPLSPALHRCGEKSPQTAWPRGG
jgi:hypothetical protein